MNKWILGFLCLIVAGIGLAQIFKDVPETETQGSSSACVPADFDWEIYIQNYEDLRRAGINTENKAQRHWVEYGQSEGRVYRPLTPVLPTQEMSVAATGSGSIADEEKPHFDPSRSRRWFDDLLKKNRIETKQGAMEFSLALWEEKRKAYFS